MLIITHNDEKYKYKIKKYECKILKHIEGIYHEKFDFSPRGSNDFRLYTNNMILIYEENNLHTDFNSRLIDIRPNDKMTFSVGKVMHLF